VPRVLASGKKRSRVYPGAVDCGTAGYITLGSHAAYNRNNIVISACWKPPTAGYAFNNARIISIATSVNDRLELIVPGTSTSNGLSIAHLVAGAGPGSAATTGRLRNAKWQHLIVSCGASGLYIFHDGAVIYSDPTNQAMAWPSNPTFVVGTAAYSLGTAPSIGAFTDITIHSSEITTADQALALYLDDVNPSTPIAHWAFDDLTGTSVSLTSGSGNNGTITGGVWTDNVPMAPRDYSQNLNTNSENVGLWFDAGIVATGATLASPLGAGFADLVCMKETGTAIQVRRSVPSNFPTNTKLFAAQAMVAKYIDRKRITMGTGITQTVATFDLSTGVLLTQLGVGIASSIEPLANGAYLLVVGSEKPTSGFGSGWEMVDDSGNALYAVTAGDERSMWVGNTAFRYGITVGDAMTKARNAVLRNVVAGSKPILFGESF
jgi:hypothetical protein